MSTIYLDMDGVLADFVRGAYSAHKKYLPPGQPTGWNFFKEWGLGAGEFWQVIDAEGEEFWANLEPYPWFDKLMATLEGRHDLVICTAPSEHPSCLSGKARWLDKHVGRRIPRCYLAKKHLLANSETMLIDDRDKNCREFDAAGGKACLFPQPWNGGSPDQWADVLGVALEEFSLRLGGARPRGGEVIA